MEKMKILQMLESGRITADEAARLLQAVDSPKKTSGYTHAPMSGGAGNIPRPNSSPPVPPTSSYTDMAGEFGRKIETFAKDMEPKIAKFTEAMVGKTANVADKISKSLSEASKTTTSYHAEPVRRPEPQPARGHHAPAASTGLIERNFELTVLSDYNELNLAALSGDILIKGYNGDKITARVSWRAKKHSAAIDLMKLGGKYYLNYDEDEFERVSVDAYIPEGMFNRVNIRTTNGRIDISTVKCEYLEVHGANTDTTVKNIAAENIKIEGDNSKLTIANINGKSGLIESFNGMIHADIIDISTLKISTFNAPINVNIASFDTYNDYSWNIETNNGKLSLNLPTHPSIGYDLKAQTTLNTVKVGLTGLNFINNTPTSIEARSIEYNHAPKKIRLNLETSNAPLIIN